MKQEQSTSKARTKNDNLVSFKSRSSEEVRAIARMGGIKSGETRRRKKELQKDLKIIADVISKLEQPEIDKLIEKLLQRKEEVKQDD